MNSFRNKVQMVSQPDSLSQMGHHLMMISEISVRILQVAKEMPITRISQTCQHSIAPLDLVIIIQIVEEEWHSVEPTWEAWEIMDR